MVTQLSREQTEEKSGRISELTPTRPSVAYKTPDKSLGRAAGKDRRAVDGQPDQRSAAAVPVLTYEGEVDLALAPELQERLRATIEGGDHTIIVDLLGATFLDSIALGVLVGALEDCQSHAGNLHLVVTEPRLLKVLEITGLTDTFAVHPDIASAQKAAGS
jgi:anti-sigma B factor antagonist